MIGFGKQKIGLENLRRPQISDGQRFNECFAIGEVGMTLSCQLVLVMLHAIWSIEKEMRF